MAERGAEQGAEPAGTAGAPTVGVVGLGSIGDGVAGSVLRAGLPLVVHDVRAEAAAKFADGGSVAASAADLARAADVVVVAVVDEAQVRSVLSGPDGALAAAGPGTTVVVVSTISVPAVRRFGAEAAGHGVDLLDCGVSGGPSAAASGDLVCMVGGDPAAIGRARPMFEAVGALTLVMGPLGAGLSAKLARNVIQYGSWLAAYEGQRLAEAAGVSLADLAAAVRASDARIGGASTLMFRQTVAPFSDDDDAGLVGAMGAAAALCHKDLAAALDLAGTLGIDLPLAELAEESCDAVFGVGGGAGAGGGT